MIDQRPHTMRLKAIGFVHSEIKQPSPSDWGQVISDIIIDSSLSEALDNLDQFSHIIVLYWMYRVRGQFPTKVHPPGPA